MGKKRVIAETGAGQHGVATATAAAVFNLQCDVYMGSEDIRRQSLNVFRMRLMGARVVEVTSGSKTLKDATNEAMRDWMGSVQNTHYIIGSVVGPHPFPMMVRDFQSVIGREAREQCLELEGRLPNYILACVGGGSNAAGIFAAFVPDTSVKLIGVEAGGRGSALGQHAATLSPASPAFCTDRSPTSCRMKMDKPPTFTAYPPVWIIPASDPSTHIGKTPAECSTPASPTSRRWMRSRRFRSLKVSFPPWNRLMRSPISNNSPPCLPKDQIIIVNLSGRGDKDCQEVAQPDRQMMMLDYLPQRAFKSTTRPVLRE